MYRPSRPMSPIPNFEDGRYSSTFYSNLTDTDSSVETEKLDEVNNRIADKPDDNSYCIGDNKTVETMEGKTIEVDLIEANDEGADIFPEEQTVNKVPNSLNLNPNEADNNMPRDASNDTLSDARVTSSLTQIANIDPDLCGMPLSLFTNVSYSFIRFFLIA